MCLPKPEVYSLVWDPKQETADDIDQAINRTSPMKVHWKLFNNYSLVLFLKRGSSVMFPL